MCMLSTTSSIRGNVDSSNIVIQFKGISMFCFVACFYFDLLS